MLHGDRRGPATAATGHLRRRPNVRCQGKPDKRWRSRFVHRGTRVVDCGSMDQNTKDILETVNFIKDRMLTKDDVRTIIREEVPGMIEAALKPIHHELREINRRLDALEEQYRNLRGVTKEIDELRAEVRAIEKHLGINQRIAA